jgi:hypothetical protein
VIHDDHVVQGVTDGNKAVIGHYSQKNVVQNYEKCEKINLCDTAFISYGSAVCLYVHQHLWDGGGSEADVHKGQVREEEVHGCMQVGV